MTDEYCPAWPPTGPVDRELLEDPGEGVLRAAAGDLARRPGAGAANRRQRPARDRDREPERRALAGARPAGAPPLGRGGRGPGWRAPRRESLRDSTSLDEVAQGDDPAEVAELDQKGLEIDPRHGRVLQARLGLLEGQEIAEEVSGPALAASARRAFEALGADGQEVFRPLRPDRTTSRARSAR